MSNSNAIGSYSSSIPQEIKIAIIAPLSKNYRDYGKQLLLAANQAINDHYTANAPIINIIPFDDQCDPENAIQIAKKIIQDPTIKAVIGHTCSANNLIANNIFAKHGILHLIPSATNNNITELGAITLFRLSGNNNLQAQSISNFLVKNFSDKKIAILHVADFYNQQLASAIQEHLAILKMAPNLYQSIDVATFDNYIKLKNIVKKMQKLNIDIIFFSGFYKESAQLIKCLHQQKIKIPVIAGDGIATPGFIEALKDPMIAAGTMMSFPKLWLKSDLNLNGQAILGYTAMQIIYTAIKNNLPTNQYDLEILNGRTLAHWLHQHKVQTILGEKSWDTNGNIIDAEFNMYIWDQNGNYFPLNEF